MKNFIYNNREIILKSGNLNIDEISYGWSDSPFGKVLIFLKLDIIVGIAFKNSNTTDNIETDMKARWVQKSINFENFNTEEIADKVFHSNSKLTLCIEGSELQLKVWHALLNVQRGATTTYSHIAKEVGNPNAVRAVASTIGKNPIAWLIPCHRVLRKSGDLGGYHWGLNLKKRMLFEESQKHK